MSEENVEVVRSVYEAWARDDLPGPTHHFDPEIEYVNPHGAIEPGTRRGLKEFARAVQMIFEGADSWQIEPQRLVPVGDHVAVSLRYRTHWRASGIEVDAVESALWTFREGKVVRYEWFHGPDDAFRAAGLSE
jgi:ketosteroid isomerase-like protein